VRGIALCEDSVIGVLLLAIRIEELNFGGNFFTEEAETSYFKQIVSSI